MALIWKELNYVRKDMKNWVPNSILEMTSFENDHENWSKSFVIRLYYILKYRYSSIISYLVSGSWCDLACVVEPGYCGHRFGLDTALEYKSLAIVLLTDGRLARERWRFTVYLSVKKFTSYIINCKIFINYHDSDMYIL